MVMRVCRALLGPADAEDAWSETFISALRAYPRLRVGSNVRGWLVTIAHRKAIDQLRAKAARSDTGRAGSRIRGDRGSRRRTRPGLVGRVAGLAVQAAQRGRVPLPRGVALRRRRRAARQQRDRGAASSRRRHRHPSPAHERNLEMMQQREQTAAQIVAVLESSVAFDDDTEARLHADLVARAADDDLLDVSYRTVESPIGSLLLAATPEGLVRVAFEREDHDSVLERLATDISPRILRAPSRLDDIATQLDEYFAGRRRAFEIPIDLQLVHGFRRAVLEHLCDIAYGTTESYTTVAAAAGQPECGAGGGVGLRAEPDPARGAVSPGGAPRRDHRRVPRRHRSEARAVDAGSGVSSGGRRGRRPRLACALERARHPRVCVDRAVVERSRVSARSPTSTTTSTASAPRSTWRGTASARGGTGTSTFRCPTRSPRCAPRSGRTCSRSHGTGRSDSAARSPGPTSSTSGWRSATPRARPVRRRCC